MISVILPVYNVENYIKDCLLSVINQTYKDFEIILVNDGTKDRSRDIAAEVLENSSARYKIIDTENRGVSAARNTGLENASGEYFVFIDSDDVIAPWFLEELMDAAKENPESELVMCTFKVCDKDAGFKKSEKPYKIFSKNKVLELFTSREIVLVFPTILTKTAYVIEKNIRFDEKVRYSEDVQYLWRLFTYLSTDTVFIPHENYNYILHANSTMTASGIDKIMTGYSGVLRLYDDISKKLPVNIKEGFVDRWVFAMLHGAAKMLSYKNYKELLKRVNGKEHLSSIKGGGKKMSLVTLIFKISPWLGYIVMRKF